MELKRIALGEFVDDLGIEPRVILFLGLESYYEEEGFVEEKVGYARFG